MHALKTCMYTVVILALLFYFDPHSNADIVLGCYEIFTVSLL